MNSSGRFFQARGTAPDDPRFLPAADGGTCVAGRRRALRWRPPPAKNIAAVRWTARAEVPLHTRAAGGRAFWTGRREREQNAVDGGGQKGAKCKEQPQAQLHQGRQTCYSACREDHRGAATILRAAAAIGNGGCRFRFGLERQQHRRRLAARSMQLPEALAVDVPSTAYCDEGELASHEHNASALVWLPKAHTGEDPHLGQYYQPGDTRGQL